MPHMIVFNRDVAYKAIPLKENGNPYPSIEDIAEEFFPGGSNSNGLLQDIRKGLPSVRAALEKRGLRGALMTEKFYTDFVERGVSPDKDNIEEIRSLVAIGGSTRRPYGLSFDEIHYQVWCESVVKSGTAMVRNYLERAGEGYKKGTLPMPIVEEISTKVGQDMRPKNRGEVLSVALERGESIQKLIKSDQFKEEEFAEKVS